MESNDGETIGLAEVAELLGTSVSATIELVQRTDFPPPVQGRTGRHELWRQWLLKDVQEWHAASGRHVELHENVEWERGSDFAGARGDHSAVDAGPRDHLVSIEVEDEAAERIRQDGGRLFVWTEPVGAGQRDRVATRPPSGVYFTSRYLAGQEVEILLEEGFPLRGRPDPPPAVAVSRVQGVRRRGAVGPARCLAGRRRRVDVRGLSDEPPLRASSRRSTPLGSSASSRRPRRAR
jgi:predicted DNA-binding transcriptional regulator AlpA